MLGRVDRSLRHTSETPFSLDASWDHEPAGLDRDPDAFTSHPLGQCLHHDPKSLNDRNARYSDRSNARICTTDECDLYLFDHDTLTMIRHWILDSVLTAEFIYVRTYLHSSSAFLFR
jgi:hypothetical protein